MGVAVLPRVVAVRIEVLELFFVWFVPHRHFDFLMQLCGLWFVVCGLWICFLGDWKLGIWQWFACLLACGAWIMCCFIVLLGVLLRACPSTTFIFPAVRYNLPCIAPSTRYCTVALHAQTQ